jgi:S-adenosylmethionine hydrolase
VARPGAGAVFLLTDYGESDEFAGVTRAVVLRLAPEALVIDLSHGVPPFDVRAGALMLSRSVAFLGPGVVVAVVDPGVGSGRRAVAVAVRGVGAPGGPRHLVGPDNGLLGWAIDVLGGPEAAVALPAPSGGAGSAGTFDGRDLFGPVAARLWLGATLEEVGTPIDPESLVRLPAPVLRVTPAAAPGTVTGATAAPETGGRGAVEAEVVWVDRFGNAQLAAGPGDAEVAGLGRAVEISVGGARRPGVRVGSFGDLEVGELEAGELEVGEEPEVGLMVDANGQLSLVCRQRSAATVLGVGPGDIVILSQVR